MEQNEIKEEKKISNRIIHPIAPIFNEYSKVLVLGSFPSVKSREGQFFYHHPQNRFWKVIAAVMKEEVPVSIEQKKAFLLKHGIAVWDVIQSCEIVGSSDSSIRNVIPNDITRILEAAPIQQIYANGNKSYELYKKYCYPITNHDIIKLPSTSPANAAFSLEKLVLCWEQIHI
ncbi:DNA-deoxyinosine glycosylase [Anaerosporobacter faecicola]|uniref:DNA-deoxyinosine glycosylase n=1 Tax=Anaerosporobacter faecicola TaxID=2718714 RepID=UPI001438C063|nr:DNA-deoxyinosine glycosylase [Anaerosporobacter faecicola]